MDDPPFGAVFTTGMPDKQGNAPQSRTPHVLAWREGTTRLLFHEGAQPGLPHLFIVPSLINRYWIFDLQPGRSLIAHLRDHAHVWVVDWDAPGDDEKLFKTSDYVERLKRAMQVASQSGALHALGYCMGGTLALLAAAHGQGSIVLVSPPWDFHAFPYPHHPLFASLRSHIEGMLQEDGMLLPEHQRRLFAMAQPWEQQRRALLPHHRRVQAWLEDGVPLAAPVAREWLIEWPRSNPLPGHAPDLGDMPVLLVHPQRDRLVPLDASALLAEELSNVTVLRPQSGHIGALVGRHRHAHLWQPLADWLDRSAKR